jgi:hypothetical protein
MDSYVNCQRDLFKDVEKKIDFSVLLPFSSVQRKRELGDTHFLSFFFLKKKKKKILYIKKYK